MSRDLKLLHPLLQEKWAELVELSAAQGLIIKNTSAVRDAEEQEDCVNRGTSSVHYPNSMHNWGVAVDFCRNDGKGAYNNEGAFFTKVGQLAESIGLIWGGSWKRPDKPHLQLSTWGDTASRLKSMYGTPEKFMAKWDKNTPPANDVLPDDTEEEIRFKIGDEVVVSGVIYGNGRGGGGSIKKNGDTMYVVDYAGTNYPNCYGVAKSKWGTRQGWAAPEIITLVGSENATEAPDLPVQGSFFPAASTYAGSSIIDALKAVGANSSFEYRRQIAVANEIYGYSGTAAQNRLMLSRLKEGKLIKP